MAFRGIFVGGVSSESAFTVVPLIGTTAFTRQRSTALSLKAVLLVRDTTRKVVFHTPPPGFLNLCDSKGFVGKTARICSKQRT